MRGLSLGGPFRFQGVSLKPPRLYPVSVLLLAAVLLTFALPAHASTVVVVEAMPYRSSIDPLALTSVVSYPADAVNLPVVVLMHGLNGDSANFTAADKERCAGYGLFCVYPDLRGRAGSQGTPDLNGHEVQDIVDAVTAAQNAYSLQTDPTQTYLVGYSGGGGNVLATVQRFPDKFNAVVSFFGPSDYAAWYATSAESRQIQLRSWIGGSPTQLPGAYKARSGLTGLANYDGTIYFFHDASDTSVPIAQSRNAAAVARHPITFFSDVGSPLRWLHGHPVDNAALVTAETYFMPKFAAKLYPRPVTPRVGSLVIAGTLDTSLFRVAFNNGGEDVGTLYYNLDTDAFAIAVQAGVPTGVRLVVRGT